jgi:hypothetical protein
MGLMQKIGAAPLLLTKARSRACLRGGDSRVDRGRHSFTPMSFFGEVIRWMGPSINREFVTTAAGG